jgi:CheY-like chemotaxis protein
MTPETKVHLFEPFFTTKGAGKGTGLGLATVYGIVKQAGGHIWVYSEPGQGTCFRIYFPRVAGVAAAGPGPMPESRGGAETVLVVEDDERVRAIAVRALGEAGYRVIASANGREALALLDRFPEAVHLLLTDVVMPEMGGRDLARDVAARRPDVKVLYVSGYTENAIVHHGVLEAGVHYLAKPFTPSTLQAKVRAVLDES